MREQSMWEQSMLNRRSVSRCRIRKSKLKGRRGVHHRGGAKLRHYDTRRSGQAGGCRRRRGRS
jgi:hypothetical protein